MTVYPHASSTHACPLLCWPAPVTGDKWSPLSVLQSQCRSESGMFLFFSLFYQGVNTVLWVLTLLKAPHYNSLNRLFCLCSSDWKDTVALDLKQINLRFSKQNIVMTKEKTTAISHCNFCLTPRRSGWERMRWTTGSILSFFPIVWEEIWFVLGY